MWSTIRATPIPRAASARKSRGVNGRPALGISALPGTRANTVWWSASGRSARLVRVADRRAVPVEVRGQRRGQREPGDPQPAAPEVGGGEHGARAAGERQPLAGPRAAEAPAVRGARLDDPALRVARVGRREVQPQRRPVRPPRGQRGGQGRRLVDDEQVAGAEVRGEVAEARVDERRGAGGDHQPHGVARQPARLRRLGRLERRRQREGDGRAHTAAFASARAA